MRLKIWTVRKTDDGIETSVKPNPDFDLFDVVMKSSYDNLDEIWRERLTLVQSQLEALQKKYDELLKTISEEKLLATTDGLNKELEAKGREIERLQNKIEWRDQWIDQLQKFSKGAENVVKVLQTKEGEDE